MKPRSKGSKNKGPGFPLESPPSLAYQKRAFNAVSSRDEVPTSEYDRPSTQVNTKKSSSNFHQKLNKQPLLRPQLNGNTKVVDGRVSSAPQQPKEQRTGIPPGPQQVIQNGFFIDQKLPVPASFSQRPVSSVSGSSGFGSGNLSTGGQELYIADGEDFLSDPPNIELHPVKGPMWKQFGLHEGEDYEGEDSIGRMVDEDVSWLMTTTQVSLSPEPEERNRVKSPTELVLRDIDRDNHRAEIADYLEATNPLSSTLRNSEPDPFATTINDAEFRDTNGFSPLTGVNRFGLTVETQPDDDRRSSPSNPVSAGRPKSRSRSNSPKSPKLYSWMGDRKSPRSSAGGKRSPKRSPQDSPVENKQAKKSPKEEPDLEVDSLFYKVPKPGAAPVAHQSAPSIATSKKSSSVKGLTKFLWEGESVESPYLEHIRKPTAINELHKLHQEIFKKSYSKVPKSASSAGKPPPATGNPTKAFAIIQDPANRGLGLAPSRLPPRNLAPIQRDRERDSTTIDFLAISAKIRETKKHVIRKEQVPHDLYVQTQMYMKQLSPPRTAARVVSSQGHVHAPVGMDEAFPDIDNVPNVMSTVPSSPKMTGTANGKRRGGDGVSLNNIDHIVSEQVLPMHPVLKQQPQHTRSPSPLNLDDQDDFDSEVDAIEMLSNTHLDPLYRILREEIEKIAQHSHTTNIIQSAFTPLPSPTGVAVTSSNTDIFHPLSSTGNNDAINLPANNRLRMRIHPTVNIVSSDIRVLSYFHSLPPGVWVTARIVYFLIMAYYETVIIPMEHAEWRKLLNMDPLWKILQKHHENDNMNIHTITKTFSWPYLQELMKFPSLFVKLLDVIENGLQLENPNDHTTVTQGNNSSNPSGNVTSAQSPRNPNPSGTNTTNGQPAHSGVNNTWEVFHENVKISIEGILMARFSAMVQDNGGMKVPIANTSTHLPHNNRDHLLHPNNDIVLNNTMYNANSNNDLASMMKVMEQLPIWNVIDNDSSQTFFLETFPLQGFQPLRDMVKAARAFLLSSSSVLFSNATYGTPLVPGSPLAVSASLTAWCKRVIALLYITGTYRAKQSKSNGVIMPVTTNSSSSTQGDQSLIDASKTLLPPGVAFSVILDSTSIFFTEMMVAANQQRGMGSNPGPVIPNFLQTCYALVKPSDALEVLVSDKIEASIHHRGALTSGRDMNNVKLELEQFLRNASASPLHRIEVISSASGSTQSIPEDENTFQVPEEENHILNQLHPILRHYFIAKEMADSQPQTESKPVEQLEFLITELRVGNKKPTLPLIPAYSKDIIMVTNTDVIPHEPITLADVVREQLNCSLALVSDSLSSVEQGFQISNRSRGYSYVVGVTDTQNSWSAFQLACRLAKESDTITLIHIPTIDYHFSYPATSSRKKLSSAISFKAGKILSSPKPSMSFEEYQRLYDEAVSRKSRVVNLYKSLGYNVQCGEIPTYLDVTARVMENYSKMLRYYRKVVQVLGPDQNYNPMKSFQFFQFNEEVRHNSRLLLKSMQSIKPDFVILGADKFDVFNGLCHSFCEPYWSFQGKSATDMTRSGPPYTKERNLPLVNSRNTGVDISGRVTSNTTVASSAEDVGLLGVEEKAVILTAPGETPPGGDYDSYSQEGFEGGNGGELESNRNAVVVNDSEKAVVVGGGASLGYDEEDGLYDEEFEMSSQERHLQQSSARSNSQKPQPIIDEPIQVFAATANSQLGNSQGFLPAPNNLANMNDFELDSFIMEDNEEGESSLQASPHMLRQMGQGNSVATSIANSENYRANKNSNSEDPRQVVHHLQMYLQYSKYPASFSDFLIHDAMNNTSLNMSKPVETNTLSYSFILANIPMPSQSSKGKK